MTTVVVTSTNTFTTPDSEPETVRRISPTVISVAASSTTKINSTTKNHHDNDQSSQQLQEHVKAPTPIYLDPAKTAEEIRRRKLSTNCDNHGTSGSYFSGEYGLIGDEQGDETHYDTRTRTRSSCTGYNSNNNSKDLSISDDGMDGDEQCPATTANNTTTTPNQFMTDKIYGRDQELRTLQDVYQKAIPGGQQCDDKDTNCGNNSNSAGSSQVVFISGYSGCGKTRLVMESIQRFTNSTRKSSSTTTTSCKPLVLHGKYGELEETPDPYQAITEALGRWYKTLSKSERSELQFIRNSLYDIVGEDISILGELIPSLKSLVGRTEGSVGSTSVSMTHGSRSSYGLDGGGGPKLLDITPSRIQFVFHSLLKTLCKPPSVFVTDSSKIKYNPVILFIDDLQWADKSTISLLQTLLKDPELTNFCFIGSYRSNEVPKDHLVSLLMLELNEMKKKNESSSTTTSISMDVEHIEIGDLDKSSVNEFVSDVLEWTIDECQPLVDVVYSKTFGNMFFTIQALEHLYNCGFINITKNKSSVCTRSTAESGEQEHPIDDEEEGEEEDGELWEYSFGHDRIREAASLLIGKEEDFNDNNNKTSNRALDLLSYTIGTVLAKRGKSDMVGKDWMLFSAVQHLNRLCTNKKTEATSEFFPTMESKLQLAELNLATSELAMNMAAFENALRYAQQGIDLLPTSPHTERWNDQNYYRTHALYEIAAEAYRLTGNVQDMERLCNELLDASEKHNRPKDETMHIRFTLAMGLVYNGERRVEGTNAMLDLLRILDCEFPSRSSSITAKILYKLARSKMTKNKRTMEEIDNMKIMSDPKRIQAMKALDKLFDFFYMVVDARLPLVIFKAMDYTFKYGLSIYAPRCFAAATVLFNGAPLFDLDGGKIYSRYCLELMKRVNHRPIECGALFFAHIFGVHWYKPFSECIPPLLNASRIGFSTGKNDDAAWTLFHSLTMGLSMGKSLKTLEAEFKVYYPRVVEKQQALIGNFIKYTWKSVYLLRGIPKCDMPDLLQEILSLTPEAGSLEVVYLPFLTRVEDTYLGNYERCAQSRIEHGSDFIDAMPAAPQLVLDIFTSAFGLLATARSLNNNAEKSKSKIHIKEAKKLCSLMTNWAKQGCSNAQQAEALLDAEWAALHCRKKNQAPAVVKKYELAIDLTKKTNFLHNQALANERLGEFALDFLSDTQEGLLRISEAIRLFEQWGATSKVAMLKEKHSSLLNSP